MVDMGVELEHHPHSKPIELQRLLIEATTEEGDFVLDPASGGYSVFEACAASGRNFIGCDIQFGDFLNAEKNAKMGDVLCNHNFPCF